jgi:hypothetical protein
MNKKIHAVVVHGHTLEDATICGRRLPSFRGDNHFYLFTDGENSCLSCRRFAAKRDYKGNLREVTF